MKAIIIGDTNILIKLVLVSKLDLNNLQCSSYGEVKWHPIVAKEIGNWIEKYNRGQSSRKVKSFGIEVLEKALDIAKRYQAPTIKIDIANQAASYAQYRSISNRISSNSAEPHDYDFLLLYEAVETDSALLTNDDRIHKIGKEFLGEKSMKLRAFLNELLKDGTITPGDISDFSKTLAHYDEDL